MPSAIAVRSEVLAAVTDGLMIFDSRQPLQSSKTCRYEVAALSRKHIVQESDFLVGSCVVVARSRLTSQTHAP